MLKLAKSFLLFTFGRNGASWASATVWQQLSVVTDHMLVIFSNFCNFMSVLFSNPIFNKNSVFRGIRKAIIVYRIQYIYIYIVFKSHILQPHRLHWFGRFSVVKTSCFRSWCRGARVKSWNLSQLKPLYHALEAPFFTNSEAKRAGFYGHWGNSPRNDGRW